MVQQRPQPQLGETLDKMGEHIERLRVVDVGGTEYWRHVIALRRLAAEGLGEIGAAASLPTASPAR